MFYGVSLGAGDPELLTLKAVRIIENCRVIAVPRPKDDISTALEIVKKAVDMSGKETLFLDLPMTRDEDALDDAWDVAANKLCGYLAREDVAMLTLGDISVYSTFSYIAKRVAAKGFEVECIPGVTSFCAAANLAKVPLSAGTEPLMIIPYNAENFHELIQQAGTKVIMKCGKNSAKLRKLLEEKNLLCRTIAAENVGMAEERLYFGEEIPEELGYFTIYIIKA